MRKGHPQLALPLPEPCPWGLRPMCALRLLLAANAPALSRLPFQLHCSLSAASNFSCCIFHKRETQKPRPPWHVQQEADFWSGLALGLELPLEGWQCPPLALQLQGGEEGRRRSRTGALPGPFPSQGPGQPPHPQDPSPGLGLSLWASVTCLGATRTFQNQQMEGVSI